MTQADLQAALNVGGEVLPPLGEFHLSQPLVLGPRTDLRGNGSTLVADYDGPCIETALLGTVLHSRISGLTLRGGGIRFNAAPSTQPAHVACEDLFIVNAACGIDDQVGSWMLTFDRIWMSGCRKGVRKVSGTTTTFRAIHVDVGAEQPWELVGVYDTQLMGCSFDGQTAGIHGPAFRALGCRGLSLTSMDFEHNVCVGGALMEISACDGFHWSGSYSVGNVLRAPANGAAYLAHIHASTGALSGVSLGGTTELRPQPTADRAEGEPTGHTATLFVTGGSHLALSGCSIVPCDRAVVQQTAFGIVGDLQFVETLGSDIRPGLPPG